MTFPKLMNNTREHEIAQQHRAEHFEQAAPEQQGHYLTDGTNLYRTLGTFKEAAASGLVGLEDCLSLEVILVRPESLGGLWTVEPALR